MMTTRQTRAVILSLFGDRRIWHNAYPKDPSVRRLKIYAQPEQVDAGLAVELERQTGQKVRVKPSGIGTMLSVLVCALGVDYSAPNSPSKAIVVDEVFEDDHLPCVSFHYGTHVVKLWWTDHRTIGALSFPDSRAAAAHLAPLFVSIDAIIAGTNEPDGDDEYGPFGHLEVDPIEADVGNQGRTEFGNTRP